jgi:hypothetical protein
VPSGQTKGDAVLDVDVAVGVSVLGAVLAPSEPRLSACGARWEQNERQQDEGDDDARRDEHDAPYITRRAGRGLRGFAHLRAALSVRG